MADAKKPTEVGLPVNPFVASCDASGHALRLGHESLSLFGEEPKTNANIVPVCVQCTYINRQNWEQPYCNHPKAVCPVNGTRHRLCHDERESASPHAYCGVSGKGFRERQADAQTKALPTCSDYRHSRKVVQDQVKNMAELFCVNPKMGWRSGVGSGVKCLEERSLLNTLAGCGTAGRLFEAANTSEVAS